MNTNIVAGTIPEKLRNRRQWKPSEGKNAGNGWNIAANLHTYDKAVELAKRAGFSGVVFINLESDPLTILDLDKCRDPETGHIQPWAQTIIERLDSYTEISSSGSGIHIILEGEKPGERVRTGAFPGLEMYHKNRPVVVTGNRLNDKEIEPRQAEIENLYHERGRLWARQQVAILLGRRGSGGTDHAG
jgi:primase-polymerase (primpol)-like protein